MEEGADITFTSDRQKGEFKCALEEIKCLSADVYQYVNGIPPIHWSRHAFSTTCKSSMILDNLCEAFNAVIKDARDKPILTCMEWLRRLTNETRYCKIHKAVDKKFEVDYKGNGWVVNLEDKTCNCRHLQLVGIPCTHAMACIHNQRMKPIHFVDKAYSREM